MVRTRYVGRPGELEDPRLAGLAGITRGHAVDMPRHLAEEMVARGLFVLEDNYMEPEGDEPGISNSDAEAIAGTGDQDLGEVAVQGFVEIKEEDGPGVCLGGFVEIAGTGARPLVAGDLPGMGEFKRDALARAGVGDWQALAALSDEECESLAGKLAGISAPQLKQWREAAKTQHRAGAAGHA